MVVVVALVRSSGLCEERRESKYCRYSATSGVFVTRSRQLGALWAKGAIGDGLLEPDPPRLHRPVEGTSMQPDSNVYMMSNDQ